MRQLTWLDLSHNQISNLRPLSKLDKLQHLWLEENPIQSYAPLKDLKNLNNTDFDLSLRDK